MTTELVYRYERPSAVDADGIALSTSTAQPYFRGFLERPDMAAAALLSVARVARTRFYVPPQSLERFGVCDPVVTSETGTLRFESFSGCCGVHARFDVRPEGLDAETMTAGTVNVDFN